MIDLDSVGCGINPETKIVYPKFKDGNYDMDNPIPLDECDEEWYENLSKKDLEKIWKCQKSSLPL